MVQKALIMFIILFNINYNLGREGDILSIASKKKKQTFRKIQWLPHTK